MDAENPYAESARRESERIDTRAEAQERAQPRDSAEDEATVIRCGILGLVGAAGAYFLALFAFAPRGC